MVKIGTLETISFPQKRVLFENKWFSVDPFLDLEALKFGAKYEADFTLDKKGLWFISEFREVK